ncbi:hypothetical protein YA0599_19100 [Pseudomonas syringae]|uniref:hypothetical protein n=1 Tax=Pseudomonas syringae TaxID=317 RepID=UPI0018E6229E|nr:hypothetical protein [Pseudomonas syringae]MBI6710335.1 hypothetical protein [Pseudomonas syringae]
MLSKRFSPLINENPQIADALIRVAEHFECIEKTSGARVYEVTMNITRLFDISQAGSSARLAKVATSLIKSGIMVRSLVIKSPMGPIIREVDSWYDCPDVIFDPLRGVDMEVNDDDIETMYSVAKDGRH